MKNLIEILTRETQSFKLQYIEKTKVWADSQWKKNLERKNYYFNYGLKGYNSKNEYYQEQKFVYYSPAWSFTPDFIDRMVLKADNHYENSILKLALRIQKMDLNIDNLSVKTAHVGVNIETVLTDGKNSVMAYTIVASGAVQRPHYRYLIK